MQLQKNNSHSLEKSYEALFNFSIDLLCINGLDGYFRLVNPAFEKLLGYTAEELKSRHFLDYIHPEDLPATFNEMEKRKKGLHTNRFENRYRRKDGSYVWIEWTSFPVLEKGEMYAVGHDITARKQAENEHLKFLEEKSARHEAEIEVQRRDEFIAIASHELKTPLTSLKLKLEIIPHILQKIDFQEKESYLKLFDHSLHQLEHFEKLIETLLDMNPLKMAEIKLQKELLLLSPFILKIISTYESEIKASHCTFQYNLDPELQFYFDPTRIEQVITNLISNALKFGSGKPIEISTFKKNNLIFIQIKDHGIGISLENQTKIFDRFFRINPISEFSGFGLGLYITKLITHAHSGKIEVESDIGKGAKFTLIFPIENKNS